MPTVAVIRPPSLIPSRLRCEAFFSSSREEFESSRAPRPLGLGNFLQGFAFIVGFSFPAASV